jgi:hypothetical protein
MVMTSANWILFSGMCLNIVNIFVVHLCLCLIYYTDMKSKNCMNNFRCKTGRTTGGYFAVWTAPRIGVRCNKKPDDSRKSVYT